MYTFLVVEDSRFDREIFGHIVRSVSKDINIIENKTGEGVAQQAEEKTPHIIFLDIHLLGKKGTGILKELRENRVLDRTYIAMMSGTENPEHILDSYSSGADFYFVKPPTVKNIEELLTLLDKHEQR